MDPNSDFQKAMVEYLEGVHQGEFITGTLEDVCHDVNNGANSDGCQPPTYTLPEPPPPSCKNHQCQGCFLCWCLGIWVHKFKYTIDDLLRRSNVHEW